ncbi:MAG TPA: hypothetical protein VGG20_20510 [Thermoanaerobaculia bacterium]|jgi:hypothetical protein
MPSQIVNRSLLVHTTLADSQRTVAVAQHLQTVDLQTAVPAHALEASRMTQLAGTSADFHPAVLNTRLATVQPLAVSNAVSTIRPELVHWLDPGIGRGISDLGNDDAGKPRSAFALPVLVSPTATPEAGTLFEEPAAPAQKHYLPVYGIASVPRGATEVKWVSLEPAAGAGGGWRLIVHLKALPAPAAPADATLAPVAPTPIRYLLSATDPKLNTVQTWEFGEAAEQDGVLQLTLTLTGPDAFANRDKIHRAMIDPDFKAKLVIRHSLELALPVPAPAPPRRIFVQMAPILQNEALETSALKTAAPGGEQVLIWHPHPVDGGFPVRRQTLYRHDTVALDTTVDFTFDPAFDANVFERAPGAPGDAAGYYHLTAVWPEGGRPYTYYQAQDQPELFYFLPDRFEVTRRPLSPHLPSLAVDVGGGDLIGQALFTLSYVAAPVWDPARIAAAAEALKAHARGQAPVFVQIEPAGPKLRLKLPTDAGPAFVEQTGARVSLIAGVSGSVTLPLDPFQRIFNAFFDEVGDLLTGEVVVTVDGQETAIPFNARARSFVGEVFDHAEAADPDSGGLRVTLRNAVESPIQVDSLPVTLRQGERTVPARLASADPPLPARLSPATDAAPAGALSLVVVPAAAGSPPLDATWDAVFDLGAVRVVPDPAAVWYAVLSRGVAGTSERQVRVKLLAATFTGAGAPAAVQVEFESGATASFEPPTTPPADPFLDQVVEIAVPIRDFIVGPQDPQAPKGYRYRVRTVSATGIRTGDWQEIGPTDELYVAVPPA